jgi:ABC-type transport system involved in multi-copper enzyme maturation permease subunit
LRWGLYRSTVTSVSPLSEVRFVAQRELRKSFRSAKGIVLLVLSLLGGTAVTLLLAWVQQLKREKLADISPEAIEAARERAMTEAFGDAATGKALAHTPEVLLAVFFITIWLTPLLISLLGFDNVSGEMQHKTVRYWTLRTRRASYMVGKWLGLWTTVSAITFTMHAVIWVVCIVRGEAPASTAFGWGLRLWVITLPISAVWCGISTLVSSIFKTPILALLATFAAFFVLWVIYLFGLKFDVNALTYIYPNTFDGFLIHQRVDRWMTGLAACIGMTALYVGASSFLFTKRDL